MTESLARCRAITDIQVRLACYDETVDGLSSEGATVPLITPPEQGSAPVAPGTTSLSATEMFGREASASRILVEEVIGGEKIDFIEAAVTAVQQAAYGELIIELDNGQRWRQIDSRSLHLKAGERVRISSASIGSFLLEKSTGSRSIRVRRIDS